MTSKIDGTDLRTIFRAQAPGLTGPIWSKDGHRILFAAGAPFGRPAGKSDVWTVGADGGNPTNLTADSPQNDAFADYSGDGARIVFRSGRTGQYDLFLMDADGKNVRQLTDDSAYDAFPAFSPKSDEIIFLSNRDGVWDNQGKTKTFDLYALRLGSDGSAGELRRLTETPGQEGHPQFSPDGEWIVFTSEMGGINDEEPLVQQVLFNPQMYGEIYAMRLKDGLIVRLTHNKWEEGIPTWGMRGM
jgi:Tol biopolymer transport system component